MKQSLGQVAVFLYCCTSELTQIKCNDVFISFWC